jgi:GT2 family glycosyltransferase
MHMNQKPNNRNLRPETSVIIVNMNGKHFLTACLESLMQQSYSDFEIILVDNGSIDGSVEFVKEHFPSTNIIAMGKNSGFGGGNNVGIKASKGKYIALLNNDTEVDRFWLEELIKAIQTDFKISMCASKLVFADNPSIIDSAGDELFGFGQTFTYRFYPVDHPSVNKPRRCFYACAGAALYRRDVLNEIGLFDDIYHPIYFEDCDLGFRAQLFGYECLYVPTALVRHKVSGTMKKDIRRYTYLYQRNVEYLLFINFPFRLYIRFLPHHILYQAGCFFLSIFHGCTMAYIKAKLEFLTTIGTALEKRSERRKFQKISTDCLLKKLKKGWLEYKVKQAFRQPFRD